MKVIGRFLWSIVVGVWLVCAIFTTVCLLSYNDYNIAELGDYTVLVIDTEDFEPTFYKNDLAFVKKRSNKSIKVGDKIFFYNGNKANAILVNVGEVTKKEDISEVETTYFINNSDIGVSSRYVMGPVNHTIVAKHMGLVYSIFTSEWGFMFLVIFPTLYAVVYEIIMIIDATKETKKELIKNESKDSPASS